MAKYLIEGSYTAEGVRLLQKETASARGLAVKKAVESLEGEVEAMYFALGEHDVVGIVDLPDIVSIALMPRTMCVKALKKPRTT